MKNFELKFWMSCIMLALCVGFTSCGDDDEGGIAGDANELIIGTWESTWMKGWEKYLDDDDKWKTDSYDGAYTEDTYIFKKGGNIAMTDIPMNTKSLGRLKTTTNLLSQSMGMMRNTLLQP